MFDFTSHFILPLFCSHYLKMFKNIKDSVLIVSLFESIYLCILIMIKVRKIELLAPAKNADYGIEAVNHGADAVYIGAPQFSARASAGNSIADISRLINHAHQFGARVYVALNTILKDEELSAVESMIWQLYDAGTDALIIQDMGILMMNLPPIPLHASTQIDNRTSAKVKFLEQAGFSQVVLARELTLDEIREIALNTSVTLEAFIHGALCVCYSGQCYISEAMSKRSANRGDCAQFCRLPYTLTDAEGKEVVRKKHLLSMKDLNQSSHLEEMIGAGVSSLKIEGRLKDLSYLKNTVAFYRKELDRIIDKHPQYIKASSGKVDYTFEPNLEKSFNRGFTSYFLKGRTSDMWSIDSPKSIGEPIGKVKEVFDRFFVLSGTKKLNNGDGLCFINAKGELQGMRVNRVEGEKIFPAENHVIVRKGTFVYRNQDHEFEKILNRKSAERKIDATITLTDTDSGFRVQIEDEDAFVVSVDYDCRKELAQKEQTDNIKNNFAKTGNTVFNIVDVIVRFADNWFIPASVVSDLRRLLTDDLLKKRLEGHIIEKRENVPANHSFPIRNITYLGNVMNEKSKEFYTRHNAFVQQSAFEKQPLKGVPLMFTRHCIKYGLGWCPKESVIRHPYKEPFYLIYNETKLKLEFDCKNCEMLVLKDE